MSVYGWISHLTIILIAPYSLPRTEFATLCTLRYYGVVLLVCTLLMAFNTTYHAPAFFRCVLISVAIFYDY